MKGTSASETIQRAVEGHLVAGQLPCASAFVIAEQLEVAAVEVGHQADSLQIRLSTCQLGLFGYGSKAEGTHRRVSALESVDPELAAAIREGLDAEGKLSCAGAWEIADRLGVPKLHLANAAETLGVRIARCQLGAF